MTACFPPPEEFLFEDPKSYAYLTNGNLSVPGLNDMNEYEDTREAMNIMADHDVEGEREKKTNVLREIVYRPRGAKSDLIWPRLHNNF